MPGQKEHISLLDNSPQKIIRWGMFTLFLLMAVSLLLGWLISYPDVLTAEVTMTSLTEADGQKGLEMHMVLSQSQQPGPEHVSTSLLQNREELRIGRELNIRPENYEETGMLRSIISGISKKENKDSCFIRVTLPDGLLTSFHKTLHFQPGMKGRADVIVKNQSLIHKLLSSLKQKLNHF